MAYLCIPSFCYKLIILPKFFKLLKHLLAPHDLVNKVWVAFVLVLNDVVEDLDSEREVSVVVIHSDEPLGVGEEFKEVAHARCSGHAELKGNVSWDAIVLWENTLEIVKKK